MGLIVARACALLCLLALAACVGSPEVVGSAGVQPGSPDRPETQPFDPPARGPARGSFSAPSPHGTATEGSGPGGSAPGPAARPYEGLGTWIDIYDTEFWEHPVHTVRSMSAHDIRTIYLQSSNYDRNRPFVHPDGVEAIVDAAHRRGIDVVAWYLPGFRDLPLDLHRAVRTIRFETRQGNRFDSFALDI